MNLKNKRKPYLIFIVISAIFTILFLFDWFFDNWDLRFQFPIILQTPVKIEKRADFISPLVVEVVEAKSSVQLDDSIASIPQPEGTIETPKSEVEQEIYEVFGEEYYSEAVRIFKCESGLNPEAVGVNNNGTIDVGIPQINSIHGIRAKWLKNPAIAIRVGKQLFDEHEGWGPWYSSYDCHGIR